MSDSIIKHIIRERHRHQRENSNNKRRSINWTDKERRRKHANSRRNDVSKQSGYLSAFFFNIFLLLEKGPKKEGN